MRRFQRQACSVGFILVIAGACSAPDRDYDKASSGAGSGGVGGKLSIISGGRGGGLGAAGAGAGGEGGTENVGGAPVLTGGTGAVSGTGAGGALTGAGAGPGPGAGAGAGGFGETGGAGGEPSATGGRVEPGAGGSVNPSTGGSINPGTGGRAGDPCGTVVCSTPPATTCANANTVRSYGAGVCQAGACEYPPSDTRCGSNELCSDGACNVCATEKACGASCAACSSNAPHCKLTGNTSACVQCLSSRDCGGAICDMVTNRCVKGQSLLITNPSAILKFDAVTGESLGIFVSGRTLIGVSGIALGPNGHVYVADAGGNAVNEYDAEGAFVANLLNTKAPSDIAFGPDGNMYVAVAGGTVAAYATNGTLLGSFIRAISGREVSGLAFYGTDLFVSYTGTTGLLARYNSKGALIANIYDAFVGNGPQSPWFSPDGTVFVPEWQTPYVKTFASASYKPLGNFIADREGSPISVAAGPDGNLLVLSNTGKESSVRRYDITTGAFLGVLVPPGSGNLGLSRRMLVVPN